MTPTASENKAQGRVFREPWVRCHRGGRHPNGVRSLLELKRIQVNSTNVECPINFVNDRTPLAYKYAFLATSRGYACGFAAALTSGSVLECFQRSKMRLDQPHVELITRR